MRSRHVPERYLVCEGRRRSLDVRILDALVAARVEVQIEPAGGTAGLGSVRQYLEEVHGQDGEQRADVLLVQDRDLRPRAEADASWVAVGQRSLLWTRHEIENFLVEPAVVADVCAAYRAEGFEWARDLPLDQPAAEALLRALAEPLLDGHAAHLTWWELQAVVGQDAVVRRPGTAGNTAEAWTGVLLEEAGRVRAAGGAVRDHGELTPERVRARFARHLDEVRSSAFLDERWYVFDLKGKTLLTVLHDHLRRAGAGRLKRSDFEEHLRQALLRVQARGALLPPDDFSRLVERLRGEHEVAAL